MSNETYPSYPSYPSYPTAPTSERTTDMPAPAAPVDTVDAYAVSTDYPADAPADLCYLCDNKALYCLTAVITPDDCAYLARSVIDSLWAPGALSEIEAELPERYRGPVDGEYEYSGWQHDTVHAYVSNVLAPVALARAWADASVASEGAQAQVVARLVAGYVAAEALGYASPGGVVSAYSEADIENVCRAVVTHADGTVVDVEAIVTYEGAVVVSCVDEAGRPVHPRCRISSGSNYALLSVLRDVIGAVVGDEARGLTVTGAAAVHMGAALAAWGTDRLATEDTALRASSWADGSVDLDTLMRTLEDA